MEGWITYKLKDVSTKIGSGATPRGGKESYLTSGISLIRSQNVMDFKFSESGLAFISEAQANLLSNVEVAERDVLLNITGDSVARVCQAPRDILPARVNQHVAIIRPDQTKLNPELLKYYLLNPSFKDFMLGLAAAGATRNALTKSMIEDFEITVPRSIRDQRRIAEFLSCLDVKIDLNRRMNATLEWIARELFKSWFVNFEPVHANLESRPPESCSPQIAKLFPSDFHNGLPETWSRRQISQVCSVGRGASPRPIHEFIGNDIPWVKIADATGAGSSFIFTTKEKIKAVGKDKSVFLTKGSLILSNSATCGVPMFLEVDGCIHDGWLYFTNYKDMYSGFLFEALGRMTERLNQEADGTVQKNLNIDLISKQNLIVPSKQVMAEFERIHSSLLGKIKANLMENNSLSGLRDLCLSRLLSGRLVILGG